MHERKYRITRQRMIVLLNEAQEHFTHLADALGVDNPNLGE